MSNWMINKTFLNCWNQQRSCQFWVINKFIQFSDEKIKEIASALHNWQKKDNSYKDIPEFCYSAKYEEIEKKTKQKNAPSASLRFGVILGFFTRAIGT